VHLSFKHGVTGEEISDSKGVAIALNAGAALVFTSRVFDAVSAFVNHRYSKAPNGALFSRSEVHP